MSGEISQPGSEKTMNSLRKSITGKQDQGSNVDVTNYAEVKTNEGGSGAISTEMDCPIGKTPTGAKTGGL